MRRASSTGAHRRMAVIAGSIMTLCLVSRAPLFAQHRLDRLLIIAPAAPGGGWDQTARAMQHVLEAEGLVRIVEVQNVPGAAGTIGLAQFIDTHRGNGRALLVSGLVMIGATLWNDSPVSVAQTMPIARLTGEYEVVAVPAASPHRDLRSLIEALRAGPERIAWGGGSAGGTDHLLAGLIAEAAGVNPRRINYIAFSGGGEAVAALLGGNVTAGISGYGEFAAHIESGRLRALGISSPSRVPRIDLATVREQGIAIDLTNWRAVLAPPGIPDSDRTRLTELMSAMIRSDRWKRTLVERGWSDLYMDGEDFGRYVETERHTVGRIVSRLRGPLTATARGPAHVLFPAAVLAGGALVLVGLVAVSWRSRPAGSGGPSPSSPSRSGAQLVPLDWSAFLGVCAALTAFLFLLEPLGFIVAATFLFSLTAAAFHGRPIHRVGHSNSASAHVRVRARLRTAIRPAMVGIVFSTAVYVAFTRGLDLMLPAGAVWGWMR